MNYDRVGDRQVKIMKDKIMKAKEKSFCSYRCTPMILSPIILTLCGTRQNDDGQNDGRIGDGQFTLVKKKTSYRSFEHELSIPCLEVIDAVEGRFVADLRFSYA